VGEDLLFRQGAGWRAGGGWAAASGKQRDDVLDPQAVRGLCAEARKLRGNLRQGRNRCLVSGRRCHLRRHAKAARSDISRPSFLCPQGGGVHCRALEKDRCCKRASLKLRPAPLRRFGGRFAFLRQGEEQERFSPARATVGNYYFSLRLSHPKDSNRSLQVMRQP